jgi:hypothetical protein
VIEFLCPNGHRIRCQAVQVGRAAKCPRCGVKFRIPEGAEVTEPVAAGSDSTVSRPEFSDPALSDKKLPTAAATPPAGAQIEFLCPKGHRLHGPITLQGKPGKCPDCGVRFRIPTYEEISVEEEAVSQISLGRVDGRDGSDIGSPAVANAPLAAATESAVPPAESPAPHEETPAPSGESPAAPEESALPATVSGPPLAGHDMHVLFVRLWEMRPKDAAIKLYLRDGETIVPHEFLKKLSQQTRQALFTTKESDGTMSLTAVAWDAVVRVTVRGLKELPTELAD